MSFFRLPTEPEPDRPGPIRIKEAYMEWVIMATFPKGSEDIEYEKEKWENVADDMALFPEVNVRVRVAGDVVHVEVSDAVADCIRG